MSHLCSAMVIACIDFRLVKNTQKWFNELGLENNYDLLSIAGASKEIENPFVQEQISISVNLHKISQIFLVHHEDCGAYGGKEKFESSVAERNFHISEMEKAEKSIKNKYPNLQVIKVFANLKGNFEKI